MNMKSFKTTVSYPDSGNFVLYMFCGYVLIWFLQVGIRLPALGSIRIEFLVGSFLILTVLMTGLYKNDARHKSSGLGWIVTLFFISLMIQIPFSHSFDLSVEIFWDRVFKFAFMAVFMVCFVKSPRQLRYFLAAFLVACFYITRESFKGALNGSMIWENQGVPRLHGDTPLFQHPNSLAGLAMGVLPFVYYLYPVVRSKLIRIFLLALTVTSAGCVMYSGSRTAYLGLIVFGIFLLWKSQAKMKFILVASVILCVAVPLIPQSYKLRFNTIITGQDIEGHSIERRKEILNDATKIMKRYPLGVGIAAFPQVRMEMFGRFQDTHNLYLELITNIGIQGFIIFVIFILKMLLTYSKIEQTIHVQLGELTSLLNDNHKDKSWMDRYSQAFIDHKDDLNLIRAAALAGMGYTIIRLALGLFGMDTYEIYWWIGLGLAVSLFNIHETSNLITNELMADARAHGFVEERRWGGVR